MSRSFTTFFQWLMVLIAISVPRALPAQDASSKIDALMARYLELDQFNGSVLVAKQGELVIKKGYGMANFDWSVPNAPDTRFRIGSMTKQFTAALVVQLADERKLSLDARLSDVLPWYRKDTGSKITIRQLLTHTSGLSQVSVKRLIQEHRCDPIPLKEEVMAYCVDDLVSEPGTAFAYNNAAYLILGAVVEEITGLPFQRALSERILDPAGMKNTSLCRTDTILARRAQGYERDEMGLRPTPYTECSIAASAGGMVSTVEDMLLWDQALYGSGILSEKAKKEAFDPALGPYGFGWFIQYQPVGPDGAQRKVIHHPGNGEGFYSLIVRVPEERVLVVLMNNVGKVDLYAVSSGILDILYGRVPPWPLPPIADALMKAYAEGGIDAAVARYRHLKSSEPSSYDFGENQLNALGYGLLRSGKPGDAVALFRLNAEAHPRSSNVWDSLGEGLAAMGSKDEAVRSYEKSLELNPKNDNARAAIQKLMAR